MFVFEPRRLCSWHDTRAIPKELKVPIVPLFAYCNEQMAVSSVSSTEKKRSPPHPNINKNNNNIYIKRRNKSIKQTNKQTNKKQQQQKQQRKTKQERPQNQQQYNTHTRPLTHLQNELRELGK